VKQLMTINIRFWRKGLASGKARTWHFRWGNACALFSIISVTAATALLGTASARQQNASKDPKEAVAQDERVANGRKLFVKYGCYECHGFEAQGGGSAGPRIGPDPVPLPALIGYVRAPAREMPPYTDKVVSDKELGDIYEFLKSLPHPAAAKPPLQLR
jgi:mono/diheme cytochrome c family protein